MMKNINLIIIILFLISCKDKSLHEIKKENDYYKFKMQISPNGKYEIYNYCRFGTFAFSSDICGSIIVERGKKFSESGGYRINGDIHSWKNDTLIINRFDNYLDQPQDTIVQVKFEKYKDLNLKILNYGAVNSSGMMEYSFDSFNLNDKEICLENIERTMGEDIGKNKCYALGSFEIINTKDSLKEIIVKTVAKSMNFTYANPDGTYTENLPEINVLSLHFKPKKIIKPINTKSLKGVFNDIK